MQFPDISSLPPWAQVAVILAFGVSSAIIVFVTRFGFAQGLKMTPEAAASKAPVAAMIVDSTALNRATAAIEAHTNMLHEHNDIMRVSNEVHRDFADYARRMAVELDRIREELRIQRELAKYSEKVAK
ncbi:MAG: hypothetical protein BGO05_05825 [Rhizobiales bacterium 63-7]|nr:MAG: hypothetical protein BGO05_05825 [Rhizobiales bacterium 63-7]